MAHQGLHLARPSTSLRDPAERSSAGLFVFGSTVATRSLGALVGLADQTRRKMKQVLWGVAIFLVLTTAVRAEEVRTEPVTADSATEDCSKQVWPKLFPVVPPQHRSNGEC